MVNVLIVYAHDQATSFNAAMLDTAMTVLRQQGHTVTVSDLLAMKFNPVVSESDIIKSETTGGSTHFNYGAEVSKAWKEGRLVEDIKTEQKKMENADFVIFQFPMHFGGLPAIMKGWIDRILCGGFAFNVYKKQIFENGKMKGKKALLSITTACGPDWLTPEGLFGDIEVFLWPIQYKSLRFCGFEIISPHISYLVDHTDDVTRKAMLDDWEHRLGTIMEETPLQFVPLTHFEPVDPSNPVKGFALKDERVHTSDKTGLTTAQHLGHLGKVNPMGTMIKRDSPYHPLNKRIGK